MQENYLKSTQQLFRYYKLLGERTFDQLSDEQLFQQVSEESNSIAVIARHLAGNMRSRWTDFLTTDGEKEWRNRESEFVSDFQSRTEMLLAWKAGWQCALDGLDSITSADLDRTIYIRNMGHTLTEAINRQLGHYAYHVGQIVFLGKMLCGSRWQSLSIPKGGSDEFNARKFDQPKGTRHFTDDYLDRHR